MAVIRGRLVGPDDSDTIEELLPLLISRVYWTAKAIQLQAIQAFPHAVIQKLGPVISTQMGQRNSNRLSFGAHVWLAPGDRGQLTRSLILGMWPWGSRGTDPHFPRIPSIRSWPSTV